MSSVMKRKHHSKKKAENSDSSNEEYEERKAKSKRKSEKSKHKSKKFRDYVSDNEDSEVEQPRMTVEFDQIYDPSDNISVSSDDERYRRKGHDRHEEEEKDETSDVIVIDGDSDEDHSDSKNCGIVPSKSTRSIDPSDEDNHSDYYRDVSKSTKNSSRPKHKMHGITFNDVYRTCETLTKDVCNKEDLNEEVIEFLLNLKSRKDWRAIAARAEVSYRVFKRCVRRAAAIWGLSKEKEERKKVPHTYDEDRIEGYQMPDEVSPFVGSLRENKQREMQNPTFENRNSRIEKDMRSYYGAGYGSHDEEHELNYYHSERDTSKNIYPNMERTRDPVFGLSSSSLSHGSSRSNGIPSDGRRSSGGVSDRRSSGGVSDRRSSGGPSSDSGDERPRKWSQGLQTHLGRMSNGLAFNERFRYDVDFTGSGHHKQLNSAEAYRYNEISSGHTDQYTNHSAYYKEFKEQIDRPCFRTKTSPPNQVPDLKSLSTGCSRMPEFLNSLAGYKGERTSTEMTKKPKTSVSELEMEESKAKHVKRDTDRSVSYSSAAQKMMEKMGHRKGEGLGVHGQGRVQPVEASSQKGRRGLGLDLDSLPGMPAQYEESKEICEVKEVVSWLESPEDSAESIKDLDFIEEWCRVGEKKQTLENENNFCNPELLNTLLSCKTVLDGMPTMEKTKARSRSNPFESIKNCIFLNRAAVKMANLDVVFDRMFTDPRDTKGVPLVQKNELLYFADVCAGPGGFSEYVLWKKRWRAKGIGFTLKGNNDFRLEDFYAGPCESFEPYYGLDNTGNIYIPGNIRGLIHEVNEMTNLRKLHCVMADGGFSVEGQENIQEILSHRLYLCQCLVALSLLRTDGNFVCKLFDVFTPFSAGIVYLMYLSFKQISIHKPNTSRPANSERYLVCKWKKSNVEHIQDYMFKLNMIIERTGKDITEVVPLEVMLRDKKFHKYLTDSNNMLAERQINSLAKLQVFFMDDKLVEEKQKELKARCLEYWNVPNETRKEMTKESADIFCRRILNNDSVFIKQEMKICTSSTLTRLFPVHDWHVTFLSGAKVSFYAVTGRKRVYEYWAGRWQPVVLDVSLELSPSSLLLGELVEEIEGVGQAQKRTWAMHIIDAFMLGGERIGHLHYTQRLELCNLYAKALTKKTMRNAVPVRLKPVHELETLAQSMKELVPMTMKNGKERLVYNVDTGNHTNDARNVVVKGLLFHKATRLPYQRFVSQSTGIKFYSAPGKDSVFDAQRPSDAVASFKNSCENTYIWYFPQDGDNLSVYDVEFVHNLLQFVAETRYIRDIKSYKMVPTTK